eukprot:12934666-Prorocentrum_lima.AAC.1
MQSSSGSSVPGHYRCHWMRPTCVTLLPMRPPPRPSIAGPRRRQPTLRSTTFRRCLATGRPLP